MAIKTEDQTPGDRIKVAQVGEFLTLQKITPAGALQARKLKTGAVALYWRYTLEGKTDRVVVGNFDSKIPPKQTEPKGTAYSIAGAAKRAAELAEQHQASIKAGKGGYRAAEQEQVAQRAADRAAKVIASEQTLKRLALAYCDHLQALGRTAHRDARSIFTLHMIEAFPAIAAMPAATVTDEQVADMLRRLYEAKKGRTANKLRAYLRAAYEVARKSRTDPAVPLSFKSFAIRTNPAAATAPISSENRPDKNPLTITQLRAYWQAIKDVPGVEGAALRLHLLTGAQRIEQLIRLRTADLTADTILLFDGKGRPGKPPRPHLLPLLDEAKQAIEAAKPSGEFALSLDGGKSHIAPATFSRWAAKAAGGISGFQAKRLRSGVETLLSSAGVSKDTRGRLQSHGISGVQATHYDAHDYLPEKRAALKTLHDRLTATQADNVVDLHAA
jgi:integrase